MTAAFEVETQMVSPTDPNPRLEPMLIRLPPAFAAELRNLARKTRVRQSDYLREAVADLLAKYGHLPVERVRRAGESVVAHQDQSRRRDGRGRGGSPRPRCGRDGGVHIALPSVGRCPYLASRSATASRR